MALLILVYVCSITLLLPSHPSSGGDTTPTAPSLLLKGPSNTQNQSLSSPPSSQPKRVSRTLVGILVDFSGHGLRYRNKFRQLLVLHPAVCSLGALERKEVDTSQCELVYTFVIGARSDGPTMQLQEPFLVPSVRDVCDRHLDQTDCMQSDMTLLNIQENMNTGKSPTWLVYGAHISRRLHIDYVAKQDTDTILYLDKVSDDEKDICDMRTLNQHGTYTVTCLSLYKFFEFAHTNLPPSPWATNIFAGWFTDKLKWPFNKEDVVTVNKFTYKSSFTLFAQGQWYMVSSDLAEKMGRAIMQHATFRQKGFLEEHEDRDIASAILLATDQHLHLIFVSKEELFWQHRVKIRLGRKFSQIWDSEIERMKEHIRDTLSGEVLK